LLRYACPENPHLLQVNCGFQAFASLALHLFIHFLIYRKVRLFEQKGRTFVFFDKKSGRMSLLFARILR
jgi:hypothetical protein